VASKSDRLQCPTSHRLLQRNLHPSIKLVLIKVTSIKPPVLGQALEVSQALLVVRTLVAEDK